MRRQQLPTYNSMGFHVLCILSLFLPAVPASDVSKILAQTIGSYGSIYMSYPICKVLRLVTSCMSFWVVHLDRVVHLPLVVLQSLD